MFESILTKLSLLFSIQMCMCLCVCVCVFGGGLWSNPDSHCIEGGDPTLELSKDKRKFLSLVLKGVYCSFDSEDRSGFLAVVPTSLDPPRKISGFFHPV